jgi:hypothetical protein
LKLTKKKHNEKTKKKPWIIVLLILHQGTIKEFNFNKKNLKTSKPLYIRHPLSILIVLKNKKTNLPPNNSRMILYHGKKKSFCPQLVLVQLFYATGANLSEHYFLSLGVQ